MSHQWLHNPATDGYFLCPGAAVDAHLEGGWEKSGPDPAIAAAEQTRAEEQRAERARRQAEKEQREREEAELEHRFKDDPLAAVIRGWKYCCLDCMAEDLGVDPDEWPFAVADAIRKSQEDS